MHAFHRVFTDGGFAGEHHAVGLFVDGIGDVGDLGTGGDGLSDHRFQHVGGDDHGLAVGDAGLDSAALDDGKLLEGALDTEIPSGDHHGIGGAHDLIQVVDGGLVFNLRDDANEGFFLREKITQERDVGGVTHEG